MLRTGADASVLDRYERQRRTVCVRFVQEQTKKNKQAIEERDPERQKKHLAELKQIAADPSRARAFLLRSSMIDSLRKPRRSSEAMHYDYIPISERRPLRWPDGKRVALILTINLETWDLVKDTDHPYYAGGPPILPDVLPGNTPDFPNYTWREYGQRVGVFRMFETFDAAGVKPGCTINAVTALRRRAMLDAALARGCEILAHNYEQGELLTDFAKDPARERAVISRTLDVYREHVGRPARGWLSSSLRGTLQTADILAEHGLISTAT